MPKLSEEEKKRRLKKIKAHQKYIRRRKRQIKLGLITPVKKKRKKKNTEKVDLKRVNTKPKYKIIITTQGKEGEYIGHFRTKEMAFKKYNNILIQNNNIEFPVHFLNRSLNGKKGIYPSDYEILLLKLNDNGDKPAQFPNEIGKLVDHIVNDNEKWIILNKDKILKEETFWVYGYDPKFQRKTYNFILNEIVLYNIEDGKFYKQISVYKNKLIIRYDDNDIDFVICKNKSDSTRLYNTIQEYCNSHKIKNIIFFGFSDGKASMYDTEKLIINKTNWGIIKVRRTSTRP